MSFDRLAVINGKMDLLRNLLFAGFARLRSPFFVVLHMAVAMFDPVFEHDLQFSQSFGPFRGMVLIMTVCMVMLVVVVHGASIRMYVAVMTVTVRMGGIAMVVRMFVDQVDPEQQFVVRDELREQTFGRHGVVLGENNGPLRDIAGDRQIVGRGDDRLPLSVQFTEELDEPNLRAGVEAVRGFIEQQHLRVRCQA